MVVMVNVVGLEEEQEEEGYKNGGQFYQIT